MKKLVLVFLLVLMVSGGVYASAVSELVEEYQEKDSRFVWAIDTTLLLGSMDVNGFNFPLKSFGISATLGLDIRNFTNIPDEEEVEEVAKKIKAQDLFIDQDELLEKVLKKIHPGSFRYFQYGSEVLLCPKIGVGQLIPFSKDLDNLGYIDLGFNFPFVFNFGLVFTI